MRSIKVTKEMTHKKNSFQLALKIARREFRGGIRGFKVVSVCLMLSVACIASIGSVSEAIYSAIDNDGRLLLGGDVDIRLTHTPASDKQLAWLKLNSSSFSEVVQMRVMTQTANNKQSLLAELKAVDKFYPLFGSLRLQGDESLRDIIKNQNEKHGAAVERQILKKLNLRIGEEIRIGAASFIIRATIDREPDRSSQVFRLGPRILISQEGLRATGLVQPGSLVRFHYRIGLTEGSEHSNWVQKLNEAFPKAGWRIQTIKNAAPNMQRFTERTALFLNLVGLTTLLISGVGIALGVSRFIGSRLTTIAILKSIGAPASLIFLTYLIKTMIISSIATIAGLGLGLFSPLALGPFFETFLGMSIPFNVYPKALLKAAAFGLLITLIFSIWPLDRARGVTASSLFRHATHAPTDRPRLFTVFSAIVLSILLATITVLMAKPPSVGLWFILGTVLTLIVFRTLARLIVYCLSQLDLRKYIITNIALKNLYRPGSQTPAIVIALGISLSVITATVLVEENISRQIDNAIPKTAPTFYFIDIQNDQKNAFTELIKNNSMISKSSQVPMLRGRILKLAGVPVQSIKPAPESAWVLRGDRGLTWSASPPEEGSTVVEGDWWPTNYSGIPLVSFDRAKAESFGLKIGDTITVNVLGLPLTARIANLREIHWNSLSINFLMIFSPNAMNGVPLSYIATAHFKPSATESEESAFVESVTSNFPNVSAIRVKDVLADINDIVSKIGICLRVMGILAVVISVLVLSCAIAANQNRRIYEAVILKVLGATRKQIIKIFACEFIFLGLITALLSAFIATTISWALTVQVMRAEWSALPKTLLITLLVSVMLTVIGGLSVTWRALGEKPTGHLRNE